MLMLPSLRLPYLVVIRAFNYFCTHGFVTFLLVTFRYIGIGQLVWFSVYIDYD